MTDYESIGERTLPPSELRKRQARMRGQSARSGDLVAVAALVGSMAALAAFGPGLLAALEDMLVVTLGGQAAAPADAWHLLMERLPRVLIAATPLVLAGLVVALLANVAQVGFVFTAGPLAPRADRVSPSANLHRLTSRRTLVRTVMTLVKLAVVAAVAFETVGSAVPSIVSAAGAACRELPGKAGNLAMTLAMRLGAVLLVLAVLDWLYQRWQHGQDLKMTRREQLEDLRQTEGDPLTRSRRRRMATQRNSE